MNVIVRWILILVRLGFVAAWLMTGIVFMFTPPAMANVLGLPDGARISMGIVATAFAVLVLVGTVLRSHANLATVGTAALGVVGLLWTVYDVIRHWLPFAFFHGLLVAVAVALLVWRPKSQ